MKLLKSLNPFAVWFAKSHEEEIHNEIERLTAKQAKENDKREKIEEKYHNDVILHQLVTIQITGQIAYAREQLAFLKGQDELPS